MIRYSHYIKKCIYITERFNAFLYYNDPENLEFTIDNYGRGKAHWFEYLGSFSEHGCILENSKIPIKMIINSKDIPILIISIIRELECYYLIDD